MAEVTWSMGSCTMGQVEGMIGVYGRLCRGGGGDLGVFVALTWIFLVITE